MVAALVAASWVAAASPVIQVDAHAMPDMERSPFLWLVNVCRTSCGFCMRLAPVWAAVAHQLRHEVRVGYWEAETNGRPGPLLGPVNATPTIRALVPSADGRPKQLVTYEGDRSAEDLTRFARALMPGDVEILDSKDKWTRLTSTRGFLPLLLVVTSRAADHVAAPMLKALAAQFDGRARVCELRTHSAVTHLPAALLASLPASLLAAAPATACVIDAPGGRPTWLEAAPTVPRLRALVESALRRRGVDDQSALAKEEL